MPNKQATLILAKTHSSDLSLINGDVIAVDKGVDFALKHDLTITHALGDFDSISKSAYEKLIQQSISKQIFPKEKAQSDVELAIAWATTQGYDTINIVGFSGGRLDHYQALLQHLFFIKNPNIKLVNARNEIRYLGLGKHRLTQDQWQYFSLYTLVDATISIRGARYPLERKKLTVNDTYTLSNAWVNRSEVELELTTGGLLLFLTK
jgi:thiamine pyrophosphokinase